jgi:DNA-binding Xre family transcriptional regulator
MRILRTCVIEVFDCQIDYFKTLSFYDPRWGEMIVKPTIDSALGLISSAYFDSTSARKELNNTLSAHISQREDAGIQPQISYAASDSDSPLMVMAKTAARRAQQQVFAPIPPQTTESRTETRGVYSPAAVEKVEAYMKKHGLNYTEFANKAGTSDKTLRKFRNTKRIRAGVLDGIAGVLGLTREQILKD